MSNNDCVIIKEINKRLQYGESIEDLIPFNLEPFSDDVKKELLMLYLKYGNNEHRIELCTNILKELDNA